MLDPKANGSAKFGCVGTAAGPEPVIGGPDGASGTLLSAGTAGGLTSMMMPPARTLVVHDDEPAASVPARYWVCSDAVATEMTSESSVQPARGVLASWFWFVHAEKPLFPAAMGTG